MMEEPKYLAMFALFMVVGNWCHDEELNRQVVCMRTAYGHYVSLIDGRTVFKEKKGGE